MNSIDLTPLYRSSIGFDRSELDINVEKGVLTVRGEKQHREERKFLHQGIANRTFERKFNLADHMEVTAAALNNGLLTIALVKEIPEAMKPNATNRKLGFRLVVTPI